MRAMPDRDTSFEPAPGLQVSPSVRLTRVLGHGGMGAVWAADHLTLHTQVAVKFMSEALARNPAFAARFNREATAVAQIKSPHVVQVYDHGVLGGHTPYIVMELLEGEDLGDRIQRLGPLPVEMTAQVLVQTCKALSRAHALDIIHRDIKPDNIFLVDSDGDVFVKLLDFGIAKQMAESIHVTSTGAVMGTPHYMSPEQIMSSKHVDNRADLWALGVVAYHCLTASVPFDGETFGAIAVRVSDGSFKLPHADLGFGSPQLDDWFRRAMHRDMAQRFSSAKELGEAFAAAALPGRGLAPSITGTTGTALQRPAAVGSPATFTGTASTARTGAPDRPSRLVWVATAGAVVLAAGAGAALLLTGKQDDAGAAATSAEVPPEPAVSPPPAPAPPVPEVKPQPEIAPAVAEPAMSGERVTPSSPATAATATAKPAPRKTTTALRPAAGSTARASSSAKEPPATTTKAKVKDRGF